MAGENQGALTKDDFLAIWKATTDGSYNKPLLKAGDGDGLEVHTQAMIQLEALSEGVDVQTQALFIMPYSGQTHPPAGGARKARVQLTFTRAGHLEKLLILKQGQTVVQEKQRDWGDLGDSTGEDVLTGRNYILEEDAIFIPGSQGPITVWASAERPGYGYNNPLPGTINTITEYGAVFTNDHATVNLAPSTPAGSTGYALVTTQNEPDMFTPDQLGQYVFFTSGLNAGRVGRLAAFFSPDPLQPFTTGGSSVDLPLEYVFEGVTTGTFQVGEQCTVGGSVNGTILGVANAHSGADVVIVQFINGSQASIAPGVTVTGILSGATHVIGTVLYTGDFVAEAPSSPGVGGAEWRMFSWTSDWGLTCVNAESPADGRPAILDALGYEHNIRRAPGEDDEFYRIRVHTVGDTVSPNAIRRAAARVMGSIPWCFQEVGSASLPGFFYDGDLSPAGPTPHGAVNDAYDTTTLIFTIGLMEASVLASYQAIQYQGPIQVVEAVTGNLVIAGYLGTVDTGTGVVHMIARHKPHPYGPGGLKLVFPFLGAPFYAPLSTAITVAPSWDDRRGHVYFDYIQFRGFFQVCVPPLGYGEFGFAYDVGTTNAYDSAPYKTFYDGYPYLNSAVYSRLYQAIAEVHAGGVAFDLCTDSACTTPNG